MGNMTANQVNRKMLSEDVLKEWQNLLDETAEILGVPAGLITRVDGRKSKSSFQVGRKEIPIQ